MSQLFDNICTLPLSSDLLTQAIHPSQPIFAVGLASGHLQCFRLPGPQPSSSPVSHARPDSTGQKISTPNTANTSRPRSSSLSSRASFDGTKPSLNGFGTVDTMWRTRRHRGSCRALAFSNDGTTLFSAGTDGLIKAAGADTGRVHGKILVPRIGASQAPDVATVLLALSDQNLVLGTETGAVHILPLRTISEDGKRFLTPSTSKRAIQTFHPHRTEDKPRFSEPINSLTALPPSATSTSRISRSFVSTSADSLAVCDLHKGVVACSTGQDEDIAGCVCFEEPPSPSPPTQRTGPDQESQKEREIPNDLIIAGQANGVASIWRRAHWQDRFATVTVHKSSGMSELGLWEDDAGVESLAVSPANWRHSTPAPSPQSTDPNITLRDDRIVAAGLANGAVKFLRLDATTRLQNKRPTTSKVAAKVMGSLVHDERGIESIIGLAFDVEGRLISGGGDFVKIWHAKPLDEQPTEGGEDEESGKGDEDEGGAVADGEGPAEKRKAASDGAGSGDDGQDSSEESDEEEEPQRKSNKKRRRGRAKPNDGSGDHGIFAIEGLD